MPSIPKHSRSNAILIGLLCVFIALVSARPYAGGWNDGSRLAAVQSLVDDHTWAIDRSIFVQPPATNNPYRPILPNGTSDKLLIDNHWYSDKTPVPSLLMAGLYQAIQSTTGLKAAEHPKIFCYIMTIATSGLAYVAACLLMLRLAAKIDLNLNLQYLLTGSFALATLALPYTRNVNNHILLLAVTTAMMLLAMGFDTAPKFSAAIWLGALAGLGYAIEQAGGPVLVACSAIFIAWCPRGAGYLAVYLIAAAPLIVLHHILNYHIGHVFAPANSVPQYLQWPGSSFDRTNMSGICAHKDPLDFAGYAFKMLFSKHGFIDFNLPALLLIPTMIALPRMRDRRLTLYALALCVGVWLLCAAGSSNYSGLAASVRWFVPLLAPAFLLIGLWLKLNPWRWRELAYLSAVGAILSALIWLQGPWMPHLSIMFWPLQGVALIAWHIAWRQGHAVHRPGFEASPVKS